MNSIFKTFTTLIAFSLLGITVPSFQTLAQTNNQNFDSNQPQANRAHLLRGIETRSDWSFPSEKNDPVLAADSIAVYLKHKDYL